MFHRLAIFIAAVAALLSVQVAHAADSAVVCESGKLKVAGKYASCRLTAESKGVKKGEDPDYSKCEEVFATKWNVAESKGAGMCPAGEDDGAGIQAFIDACDEAVAGALAGGGLPSDVATCNADLTTCTTDLGACDGDLLVCDADLVTCDADLTTCEGDLAACEALPMVLKTGQTTCYNAAGGVVACATTGQDGELQLGAVRSFTDNGETITDNVTGLMWEKLSDDGTIHDRDNTYTWTNAFVKVATLNGANFAGYNDWRVPNVLELQTLANFGVPSPATYSAFDTGCVPGCTVLGCSCTFSGLYWSSTTYVLNTPFPWTVNFIAGNNGADVLKTTSQRVRAVRGGS